MTKNLLLERYQCSNLITLFACLRVFVADRCAGSSARLANGPFVLECSRSDLTMKAAVLKKLDRMRVCART